MNRSNSTPIANLAEQRRLRRAAAFLAQTMSASTMRRPAGNYCAGAYTRYLPKQDLDLSVSRSPGPSDREMLAWARSRGKSLVLLRLRDPMVGIAESSIDLVMVDGGTVFLPGYSLYTGDRRHFWLIDRHGPVFMRLTEHGLIPTVTPPFRMEIERQHGLARADRAFSDFVWSV